MHTVALGQLQNNLKQRVNQRVIGFVYKSIVETRINGLNITFCQILINLCIFDSICVKVYLQGKK